MKITIVMENSIPPRSKYPFVAEHGLSMLIEIEEKIYLFDTGQTGAVIKNLTLLGVHPSKFEAVILSHGHFDHAGGIKDVLTVANKKIPIYANEGIFTRRFSINDYGRIFTGVPFPKELLTSLGGEFQLLNAPLKLTDRLWISGPVPRGTFEKGDARFIAESGNDTEIPDNIPDDLSLYYKTDNGLVIICGCAHAGLVNIIKHGMDVTSESRLHGIIGGTHLSGVSQEDCQAAFNKLEELQPSFIAANHCTGFNFMGKLQAKFDKKFTPAFVGTVIEC